MATDQGRAGPDHLQISSGRNSKINPWSRVIWAPPLEVLVMMVVVVVRLVGLPRLLLWSGLVGRLLL